MTMGAEPRLFKGNALRERIRNERGFCATRILGQKPWPKQLEIEREVFQGVHARTAVSGCVGSTKTYALAMTALTWLLAYKPSRVFSLAPSFRQVDANLWGYIKKLWHDAELNGTPIHHDKHAIQKVPKIKLGDGWYYEGFSTDEPHNVHGLHGENDLVIIDDAHGIKKELADEIENITAGGNTKIVLAYNKMVLSGPTYDCDHVERAHWNHVGICYADLAAARAKGFKLDGALGADAEMRWRVKYGPKSNFYKVKVLNQHPSQEHDTLIPLDWIEAAFIRAEKGLVKSKGPLILGGDVAGEGDDNNALVAGRGMLVDVAGAEQWQEPDTMATVGRFVARMKEEEHHENLKAPTSQAYLFMDSCGLGGPMVNRVAEQTHKNEHHHCNCNGCQEPIKVKGLNGAESAEGIVVDGAVSKEADQVFRNLRSQIYWNLRESLNPANANLIGITRGTTAEEIERSNNLAAQLSCIKWRTGSDGRKEVEPKIGAALSKGGTANWGIKRRLGFSPDLGDAVCYLVWGLAREIHGEYKSIAHKQDEPSKIDPALADHTPDSGVMLDGLEVGGGLDGVE